MDKNEELQKWLNDDRYVRPQELSTIFGKKPSDITYLLKINGVKAKKRFFCVNSIGGSFVFYDRCECMKVKSDHDANIDKLNKCFENDSLVTRKQLQSLWGVDAHSVIRRHKIKPVAIFNTGSRGCNFYDRAECERARIFIDNDSILQSYLQNSKYTRISELSIQWNIKEPTVWHFLKKNNIHPATRLKCGLSEYVFYSKDECLSARAKYDDKIREYDNAVKNKEFISNKDMCEEWGWHRHKVGDFLKLQCIFPAKKISVGAGFCAVLYSRAECERARQFINQPAKKEVEKVKEKQMELPKPTEQTPDIIPADTIDLFTMSELEAELKNRGVELTAEVRAKINASDMPDMQHIATMLRGNTKTITIRLSVLNEIAGRLSNNSDCVEKKEHIIAEAELLSIDDVRALLHRFNIDSHTFKSTNADVYKYARQGIGDCPDFLFFNGKRMWKRSDIMNWIETLSKRTTFYNAQIKRIESNIDLIQMKADLERKIAKLHGILYSMEESLQDLLSDITEFKNYTAK